MVARYLKSAMQIDELANSLRTIAGDDKKNVEDYTQAEVVAEAKWVLSCFLEGGHLLNEALQGEDTPQEQRWARNQVSRLRRFIKRYEYEKE